MDDPVDAHHRPNAFSDRSLEPSERHVGRSTMQPPWASVRHCRFDPAIVGPMRCSANEFVAAVFHGRPFNSTNGRYGSIQAQQ
jgi:hypothetical protein